MQQAITILMNKKKFQEASVSEEKFYTNLDDTIYENRENDQEWILNVKEIKNVALKSQELKMYFSMFNTVDISDEKINLIVQNAEVHAAASVPSLVRDFSKQYKETYRCACCGNIKGDSIGFFQSTRSMNFLGSAAIYFFFFIKMSVCIIGISAVFYSIFSFISNMIGGEAGSEAESCEDSIFCKFKINGSILNKFKDDNLVLIQYWLAVLISVSWIGIICYMYYQGEIINEDTKNRSNSPSSRSIKISNLPQQSTTQPTIALLLKKAWLSRPNMKTNSRNDHISIKSIHLVYDISHFRDFFEQIQKESIELWDCFIPSTDKSVSWMGLNCSEIIYAQKKSSLKRKLNEMKDAKLRFLHDESYREKLSTTCAIVEFETEDDQKDFMKAYDSITFRFFFMSIEIPIGNERVKYSGRNLRIQDAPEPEDVYWQNAQKPYNCWISLGIYFAALLIVVVTQILLVAIDIGQNHLGQNNIVSKDILNLLDYVKTVVLNIFNAGIDTFVEWLIPKGGNHTLSEQRVLLLEISTLAQTLNTIAFPFCVQYFTTKDYYGADGVSGAAFDYAVSSTVVSNVLLILDLTLLKKLILYIRCLRNSWIRSLIKFQNDEDIKNNQIEEVNKFYEGGDLDMNGVYNETLVDLFAMAFFANMQPFIVFIFLLGMIIKWGLLKYFLIRRYNYPEKYHKIVFDNVVIFLKYLPLMLGLGMATTLIISDPESERSYLYIPSGICIGFTILNRIFNIDFLIVQLVKRFKKKKTRATGKIIDPGVKFDEYHETSNLAGLLGYQSKLYGKNKDKALEDLEEFVTSFGSNKE